MIINLTKSFLKDIIKFHIDNDDYPKVVSYNGRSFKFNCNFNNVLIYDNTDKKDRDFIFIKLNDIIINCLDNLSEQFNNIDTSLSEDFLHDFEEYY